ncbi:MAG: sortase [Candidatus Peribacteraceae bacterium]|nr:sortase [Candidatus Peribacteraceae bacterium]
MISESSHLPPAEYDDEGNIIFPTSNSDNLDNNFLWTVTEEDTSTINTIEMSQYRTSRHNHDEEIKPTHVMQSARQNIFLLTKNILQESTNQYKTCMKDCCNTSRKMIFGIPKIKSFLWSFLSQPVWVVNKEKKKMKEYSRFSLFLLDTVRFGGTFAILFLALFVSLNFKSYFEIGQSYFHPLKRLQESVGEGNVDNLLKDKLLKTPTLAVAGDTNGNLINYLPGVGPPENRIIIPRLKLNIPLVTPSYESLLNENWNKLEEDIQDALEVGVVHYPGTARPGQAGNFFVTGHSSYYPWAPGDYKNVFARLHDLEVGDEYWTYYGGDKHRYIVQSKKEVKPSNVDVLDQPVDKRISTLMTCTPVGTTLRRLIIQSQEVDPITGMPLGVGEHESRPQQKIRVEALPI